MIINLTEAFTAIEGAISPLIVQFEDKVDQVIEKISEQRAMLGAYQNRLVHIIAKLDNTSENLQAPESRIGDVDMAQEMMELMKHNILQQASTAMLAQANNAPQSVLQLLG